MKRERKNERERERERERKVKLERLFSNMKTSKQKRTLKNCAARNKHA